MSYTPTRLAVILASTAAAGASGVAIAGAANSSSSSSSTTASKTRPQHPPNSAEKPLTGDAKTKAEAAALAAVPGGKVWRSTNEDPADPSGAAYEVHVTKSDGSEVEVLEDSSFTVTKTEASQQKGGMHGGPGGHRGPGMHADLAAVAKALGVTQAQLQTALDAARPAKGTTPPSKADHEQQETAMYAAVAKSLGLSASDVQKAFEANRPPKPTR